MSRGTKHPKAALRDESLTVLYRGALVLPVTGIFAFRLVGHGGRDLDAGSDSRICGGCIHRIMPGGLGPYHAHVTDHSAHTGKVVLDDGNSPDVELGRLLL